MSTLERQQGNPQIGNGFAGGSHRLCCLPVLFWQCPWHLGTCSPFTLHRQSCSSICAVIRRFDVSPSTVSSLEETPGDCSIQRVGRGHRRASAQQQEEYLLLFEERALPVTRELTSSGFVMSIFLIKKSTGSTTGQFGHKHAYEKAARGHSVGLLLTQRTRYWSCYWANAFLHPVQLSEYNRWPPGFDSKLLKQWHTWRAGIPVQAEQVAGSISCSQQ